MELFIKIVVTAWEKQNTGVDQLLESIPAEKWMEETAPGRNTGIYLLGHLIAVNDDLFRILGLGERLYPGLDPVFITNPDKAGLSMPTLELLKSYWREVNLKLSAYMARMQPGEWFERHTVVSEADFLKEPHRNKLNVLISRTNHQSYHLGQLSYLVVK